jgi:hypothetical protein
MHPPIYSSFAIGQHEGKAVGSSEAIVGEWGRSIAMAVARVRGYQRCVDV